MLLFVHAALAAPTHAQMEAATWSHYSDRSHDDAGEVKVFRSTVAGVDCFKATAMTSEVVTRSSPSR